MCARFWITHTSFIKNATNKKKIKPIFLCVLLLISFFSRGLTTSTPSHHFNEKNSFSDFFSGTCSSYMWICWKTFDTCFYKRIFLFHFIRRMVIKFDAAEVHLVPVERIFIHKTFGRPLEERTPPMMSCGGDSIDELKNIRYLAVRLNKYKTISQREKKFHQNDRGNFHSATMDIRFCAQNLQTQHFHWKVNCGAKAEAKTKTTNEITIAFMDNGHAFHGGVHPININWLKTNYENESS